MRINHIYWLLVVFSVLTWFAVLSACNFLETRAVPEVARAVDRYCDEVPHALRLETRKLVNATVKPGNNITINCAGDPPADSQGGALNEGLQDSGGHQSTNGALTCLDTLSENSSNQAAGADYSPCWQPAALWLARNSWRRSSLSGLAPSG